MIEDEEREQVDSPAEDEPQPAPEMKKRFRLAMSIYAALGILAGSTLTGKIRIATILILGMFAFKTWLAVLKDRAD